MEIGWIGIYQEQEIPIHACRMIR